MELNGTNCYYGLSDVSLGNYSYFVTVTDIDAEISSSPENWTVGQYCDVSIARNLTLAADLEAALENTPYCYDMDTPGVTLDCNGFGISLVDGSGDSAIRMGASNTSVINCHFLGSWDNSFIMISDFIGGNQSGFQIINNSFDPDVSPSFGDIATDFGTTEFCSYALMQGNSILHGVVVSGNILNLDFIGNILSGDAASGSPGSNGPDALLFEEQGNGDGIRDYWQIRGNIFNSTGTGAGCISTDDNIVGGSHATIYADNICTTDDEAPQMTNGMGNFSIINSTFIPYNRSLWLETQPQSFISQAWYLYVNVTDSSGSAISNASVACYDVNGTEAASGFTDAGGMANFTILGLLLDDSGNAVEYTPHNVTVAAVLYRSASIITEMNRSLLLDFALADYFPPTNYTFVYPTTSGRTLNNWFYSNLTFYDADPNACVLVLAIGTNYTMEMDGTNAYLLVTAPANGIYDYVVICNDTFGNSNSSPQVTVIVDMVPDPTPIPAVYVSGSNPGTFIPAPTAAPAKEDIAVEPAKPPVMERIEIIVDGAQNVTDAVQASPSGGAEALFDIVVTSLEKNLATGGVPSVKISLTKFNEGGKIEVNMLYEIRDGTGKAIRVAREARTVELTEDFIVSLGLPENAPSGKYEFYAKITYGGGKIAESSDTFEYLKKEAAGNKGGSRLGFLPHLLGIIAATSLLYFWQWKGKEEVVQPDEKPLTVRKLVHKPGSAAEIKEYALK
ncbi:MAG: carboxypeptidase-like regulatory domain-containing protein [Candidatus Micrarchaeota archaeon]